MSELHDIRDKYNENRERLQDSYVRAVNADGHKEIAETMLEEDKNFIIEIIEAMKKVVILCGCECSQCNGRG